MRKIIYLLVLICLCVTFTLGFTACSDGANIGEITSPAPDIDNDSETDNGDDEENNETPTKKYDKLLKVTATTLNIRSSANSSSTILGKVNKGDLLPLIEKTGNFYAVTYKNKVAYIHQDYATQVNIETTNEKVENLLSKAKTLLGFPYVYGAQRYHFAGKLNGNFIYGKFDCSSLTQYVYYFFGVNLGATTREQVKQGATVAVSDLKRGDLMFFTNANRKHLTGVERVGHVAIYFGDNYILHTASDYAVIEQISSTRWGYFISAKRFELSA
jgi:peptidoglycan endopeptidase LytE